MAKKVRPISFQFDLFAVVAEPALHSPASAAVPAIQPVPVPVLKVKEEIWWDGTRLTEAQEAERWTLTTGEKLDLCGKDRSRATPQDFFEVAPVRDKESTLEKPLILLAVFPDTLIADRNAAYQRYLATAKADPARSQAGRRDIIGDPVLFAEWAELESSLLDLQIAETTARAIREREAKRGA